MRRWMSLAMSGAFTLTMASVALGQGQIAGSLHDFRNATWAGSTGAGDGDFCMVCHTPHSTSAATAPLWNHSLSAATFTMYSSSTMNATAVTTPDGESAVCLGCHDGQTALNAYGGNTPSAVTMSTITRVNPNSLVGTNLQNDHPISIDYASAISGGDLTLNSNANVTALLRNGKVQCASCHDPHGKPGLTKFQRMSNAGSALCITCHNK